MGLEGLLIPTIATRGELDEFEQQNIEQAVAWSLGRWPVSSGTPIKTYDSSNPRADYLKAIKAADAGNIKLLIDFAKS
jgi:hypothetical protein